MRETRSVRGMRSSARRGALLLAAAFLVAPGYAQEDEAARQDSKADDEPRGGQGKGDGVSLRQRVWPLVDMLKRAHAHREVITWGA